MPNDVQMKLICIAGANLEAEDSDGDTALHNVLLFMKNSRQATSIMTMVLNVMFQVQPRNLEKAPKIFQVSHIHSDDAAVSFTLTFECLSQIHVNKRVVRRYSCINELVLSPVQFVLLTGHNLSSLLTVDCII